MATITGTGGDDTINPGLTSGGVTGGPVTNNGDTINALGGNDTITGGSGNDTIDGGAGTDIVIGGQGNDSLLGGAGIDLLNGGLGDDTLIGGAGADQLVGGDGNDTVSYLTSVIGLTIDLANMANSTGDAQGDGFDTIERILATAFADTIQGDGGANILLGDAGDDVINGNTGNDQLFGGAGNDQLNGGDNADTLDGGLGNDDMTGGLGDDTFVVDNVLDFVFEAGGQGNDQVFAGVNWTMFANIEVGRMFGAATLLTGSSGDEQLVANAAGGSTVDGAGGADTLWGSVLADTLLGGTGDDILRSQGGADSMAGGTGNDQYVVADFFTIVTELFGQGTDTIYVTVNGYVVSDHVEITRLGGFATQVYGANTDDQLVANATASSSLDGRFGNDVLWGSSFADLMNGGAGDDILRGQGGADTMYGGAGNDQFVCFDAFCEIIEGANAGYDIVYFAGGGSFLNIGDNIEEARLVAQGTSMNGNDQANLLVGNSSNLASSINGGGGNDIIYGTTAADTIDGQAGNDTIYSQGGADRFIYNFDWGVDLINGFVQGQAKLQFIGRTANELTLSYGNGNTQVTAGADVILVFGATLTAADFIFS